MVSVFPMCIYIGHIDISYKDALNIIINQLIVQVLCFVKEKNTLLTHIPENVYSPLLKKNRSQFQQL